jgi:hypothetical protein
MGEYERHLRTVVNLDESGLSEMPGKAVAVTAAA